MEKGEKKAKPEVRLNGQLYKLRFDLYALEQIEEKFGGMKEAFAKLQGGSGMVKSVKSIFAILANSARNADGLPENVTGEEIGRHASISLLTEVADAIRAAMDEGMRSETVDGPADDEHHDGYAEEYERKNG